VSDPRPIGLFDSGVGGLTVLREVRRRLPSESTVYLGDNARAPYGSRPDNEIVTLSGECLDHLAGQDVKAIVVACSTSSSVALAQLRRRSPVPILGIVRPGAVAACRATRTGRIGVVATETTIRSGSFPRAISDELPDADVRAHATPALVPLVEAGELDGAHVRAVVQEALQPIMGTDRGAGGAIDTLLLGCTHYPLLGSMIADVVGPGVVVIDPAEAIAAALDAMLQVEGLEAPAGHGARHVLHTTGDVATFRAAAWRLFGGPRLDVRRVALGVAGRGATQVATVGAPR
jgi:glutamate racemase